MKTVKDKYLVVGADFAGFPLKEVVVEHRSIRIDTHKDNVIMHHILRKYGFQHCGVIFLANGDPREAYQLTL